MMVASDHNCDTDGDNDGGNDGDRMAASIIRATMMVATCVMVMVGVQG